MAIGDMTVATGCNALVCVTPIADSWLLISGSFLR